jgi:hypothetical protein
MNDPLGARDAANGCLRPETNGLCALERCGVCRRHAVRRDAAKFLAFAYPEKPKFGGADTRRIFQDDIENGLQVPRG